MPGAEIEQAWVALGPELPDQDLAIGVAKSDRRHRPGGAAHACAASHELQGMRREA